MIFSGACSNSRTISSAPADRAWTSGGTWRPWRNCAIPGARRNLRYVTRALVSGLLSHSAKDAVCIVGARHQLLYGLLYLCHLQQSHAIVKHAAAGFDHVQECL